MAKLVYAAIASLDGYVEDSSGSFEWAAPDDEVHAFVNDLERPIGTYLYGRRMYETMVFWETVGTGGDQPAVARDFAELWRAAEKIVYSRTLQTLSSARTRIEREFDPAAIRAAQTVLSQGHHGRRCAARWRGHRGRPGRRMPPVPRPGPRRRREAGTAGRCPGPARAAGLPPLRQRCRSPPLPGEIGGGELKLAEQVSGAGWSAAVDGEGLVHGAVGVAAHRPDVASRAGADRVEARVDR